MQDSFMTIIGIFLAGVLLFMFPLLAVSERANDQAQVIAERAVDKFVSEVATTGAITLKNYSNLQSDLATTGNVYTIDMNVNKIGDSIGKKNVMTSNDRVGSTANTNYTVYTQNIMDDLERTGAYSLKRGDTVSASIRNTNKTMAESLRGFIFSSSDQGGHEIIAESSALVSATSGF